MAGNKNSGPHADWFRMRCQQIIRKERLLEFVGRVAIGIEQEERIVTGKEGYSIVKCQPAAQTRLNAFEMLANWGVGKPVQYVAAEPSKDTPQDSVSKAKKMFDLIQRLEIEAHQPVLAEATNGNGAAH